MPTSSAHQKQRILPATMMFGLILASVALLIQPIISWAQSTTPNDATIYAAYVLVAPSPESTSILAFARVIVDSKEETCPELLGGPQPISMTFRQNPHGFEVKVCEALIPLEQPLQVSWNGTPLPPVIKNPSNIVVMGDTGCRHGLNQHECHGEMVATPFDKIAKHAKALKPAPDLILHMGDYNYRGTNGTVEDKNNGKNYEVYDAGDNASKDPQQCQLNEPYVSQNAGYSNSPDTWNNWNLDFFKPAAELMSRTPWIFTRGNHELCSRAGPGWFYFLDASAEQSVGGTGQLQCPPQGGDTPPVPEPPGDDVISYLLFTEPRILNFSNLQITVLDSANACDAYAPVQTTTIYQDQLEEVLEDIPQRKTTWLVTHRPIWGAENEESPSSENSAFPPYESKSIMLQTALADALAVSGKTALPKELKLVLSGHIHTFEALTFLKDSSQNRPPQLVVGNSGVELEESGKTETFNATIDEAKVQVVDVNHHGLLHIAQLDAGGNWKGPLLNKEAEVLAQCSTQKLPESVCTRCEASREIQQLFNNAKTPESAERQIGKALVKSEKACLAEDFLKRSNFLRQAVSLLLRAAQKGADTSSPIEHIVASVQSTTSAKILEAVEKVGSTNRKVKKSQREFALAAEKENPKIAIALFRQAYKTAVRVLSTP